MTLKLNSPLTPDSLAADGIQGANAKARFPSRAKNSATAARDLALTALGETRAHLEHYALATDEPEFSVVQAADHVFAAEELLRQSRRRVR